MVDCTATRPTIRCRATSRQLAYETQRLGLGGRVAGSHLTSMHSMDNYYVSKLLPLIAEAGVAAIPNPLINIMLQGRHDTYPEAPRPDPGEGDARARHPRRLGPGLRARPLVFARHRRHARRRLHGPACRADDQPRRHGALLRHGDDRATPRSWASTDYGLRVGGPASLVVLDAGNPVEALRLRPARLAVISRGKVVARAPRGASRLTLPGRPDRVDRRHLGRRTRRDRLTTG